MYVLVISFAYFEYDGRLRELIKIADIMGDMRFICRSITNNQINEKHISYDINKSYFNFLRFCKSEAKKLEKIDIIICDNRKGILPSILISNKHKKAILIQDIRELYIFKEMKYLFGKIGCIIEKIYNKKFDICLVANQERADIVRNIYKLKKQPIVFENIRKLEYAKDKDYELLHRHYSSYFTKHKWNIISTSGCMLDRGIEEVVHLIGKLGSDFALYIIGNNNSDEELYLKQKISDNEYSNIYIMGPMTQHTLKYFIQNCQIGLVTYSLKDMNNKFCASGKIYEFLFEELPVICSNNPPLKRLCETYKIGVSGIDYNKMILEITKNFDIYVDNVKKYVKSIDYNEYRNKIYNEIMNQIKEIKTPKLDKKRFDNR